MLQVASQQVTVQVARAEAAPSPSLLQQMAPLLAAAVVLGALASMTRAASR